MRRKRFQRGSLKDRKRRGKLRWYAQWREEGIPKSKELGLCSEVSRVAAEAMLQEILRPINEGTVRRENPDQTFESFIELVYLPIFEQKWKDSTRDTETNRIRCHLVRKLGDKVTRKIDRSDLQSLLDNTAKELRQECRRPPAIPDAINLQAGDKRGRRRSESSGGTLYSKAM